jgi:hypothetical protein
MQLKAMILFLARNDGWLETSAEVHGSSLKEPVVSVDGEQHFYSSNIYRKISAVYDHINIHRNKCMTAKQNTFLLNT